MSVRSARSPRSFPASALSPDFAAPSPPQSETPGSPDTEWLSTIYREGFEAIFGSWMGRYSNPFLLVSPCLAINPCSALCHCVAGADLQIQLRREQHGGQIYMHIPSLRPAGPMDDGGSRRRPDRPQLSRASHGRAPRRHRRLAAQHHRRLLGSVDPPGLQLCAAAAPRHAPAGAEALAPCAQGHAARHQPPVLPVHAGAVPLRPDAHPQRHHGAGGGGWDLGPGVCARRAAADPDPARPAAQPPVQRLQGVAVFARRGPRRGGQPRTPSTPRPSSTPRASPTGRP